MIQDRLLEIPMPLIRSTCRMLLPLATLCLMLGTSGTRAIAEPQAKDAKPAPDMILFTNGDQLTGTLLRGGPFILRFRNGLPGLPSWSSSLGDLDFFAAANPSQGSSCSSGK